MDGKTLHIAIPDSSKLSLMRNLKTITKKNIELHAAKVSQISNFIEKLLSESGDVTTQTIKEKNKEKTKTFESDLGEAGEVLDKKPKVGFNKISSYAEVLFEKDIESNEIINQLSSFHIWSDSYIQERRNWKPEKPMKAVFLKIMKVPEFDLPLKSEFSGCKSWIELNSNFQDTEWMVRRRRRELALEDDEIEKKLEEFKEIVK